MTSPIAAVRSLPRFAYLSPAEAREVVLAVLGAVREPSERVMKASPVVGTGLNERGEWSVNTEPAQVMWPAMIDALVAEVQEEGRPLPPASDSVDS